MFILMFTRLTNDTEESIMLVGTYEHKSDAQKAMRSEWENRINNMDWDANWSWFEDDQAFCGDEDMNDTIRYYIFDTERPCGFVNDTAFEFTEEW